MENKKQCPVCGDAVHGRIDKKFCSDLCRNAFNNQQNNYSSNYIRKVNGILRRNRRILEELNPKGKTKTTRSRLVEKGFDFRHFTGIYRTNTGNTYYFCYEQGYLPLDDNFYALVKKHDSSS
jgi:predicted nucleic acid-binding Zn ribbon protein